jgi:hypothetical protein
MMRSAKWWLSLGALPVLFLLWVHTASAKTFEWREEVALQDGGVILVSWWVRLVPGQPFQYMVGEHRLTFAHPTTRQAVSWVDPGKVGSRLLPILLDVAGGRLYLVGLPTTGPDYDGFGCPTPPYIVLRYDGTAWEQVPLSELPTRFGRGNLLGYGAERLIRESKNYLTVTQISTWLDEVRQNDATQHMGRIDRRIRNPLSLNCRKSVLERVYGAGKYEEWGKTGNWLDKSDDEAMKLLWGDEGPPCPSRSACLPCRASPAKTDGVCGWVLWLTPKAQRYAKEAEVSRVSGYHTKPECDRVLAQTLTEQGKLDNRFVSTVPWDYGEVITWPGKRGEAPPTRIQKWECLPDVMDPRGLDRR